MEQLRVGGEWNIVGLLLIRTYPLGIIVNLSIALEEDERPKGIVIALILKLAYSNINSTLVRNEDS